MEIFDSLDPQRDPHLKAALLEGWLHQLDCASCGRITSIEHEFSYFDFARRQFFITFPVSELPRADACARRAAGSFERLLRTHAPPAIKQLAPTFVQRVCFGLADLSEKVTICDAGLNDLALEELKCRLLVSDPGFLRHEVVTLRLIGLDGERLRFSSESFRRTDDPDRPIGVVADRALYDEIAALGWEEILRARPRLASGPHVSLLRLANAPGP